MRELHRWETDARASAAELKLIELLISDEPEAGMEDLSEVEIPNNVLKGLKEAQVAEEQEILAEEEAQLAEKTAVGGEET